MGHKTYIYLCTLVTTCYDMYDVHWLRCVYLVAACTCVYLHPDCDTVTLFTYVYLRCDPDDSSGCTCYIGKMIING